MKITLLTPGTGHFYCGSCLRDNTLARALLRRGHKVTVIPLYLPVVLDEPPAPAPDRVFMGGINLYLQQKIPFLRRMPRWMARLLDQPGLLRWSSTLGDMTDTARLGDMTLSMLRGDQGRHAGELRKLINWLSAHHPPDVVLLSNVLLAGMAEPLRRELGCPVVATLQGEDAFLDSLPPTHLDTAWSTLATKARCLDALIAVSQYYGDTMQHRLSLDGDRIHRVWNGIELDGLLCEPIDANDGGPVIGYLARMCPEKGLHTLVDAFIELKTRANLKNLRLHVFGVMLAGDRRFVRDLRARLADHGCNGDVEFVPNAERDQKIRFLQSISVLSVPAMYGESFGLYVLEALAAGVPVVQPRHAAFPEIIDATGGGVLYDPDDPAALADALQMILLDHDQRRLLGSTGRQAVLDHFTADRMAREVDTVLCRVVERASVDHGGRVSGAVDSVS